MRVSDLKKQTRKVQVLWEGEAFEVEYKLNAVTDEFMSGLAAVEDYDQNLSHQLENIVVRWEILDDDGKEIQPSPEFIHSTLSRPLKLAILDAVREDMRPDKEKLKN